MRTALPGKISHSRDEGAVAPRFNHSHEAEPKGGGTVRLVAKKTLQILWQEEHGQDLVEYSLLLVLIALGCLACVRTLGSALDLRIKIAGCAVIGKSHFSQAAGCF
jgi:Flp pilus assembly pilin Flp